MKFIKYSILLFAFYILNAQKKCTFPYAAGYLNLRSTGANTARELVGWQWVIHGGQGNLDESFGAISGAYEYQHSFWNNQLVAALMGSDKIILQGSQYSGIRDSNALIADMFGLPNTYNDTVYLNPTIQNHTLDFNFFYKIDGQNSCVDGLYFRIHSPLTVAKWKMRLCGGDNISTDSYTSCQFSTSAYTGGVDNAIDALYAKAYVASGKGVPLLSAGFFDKCDLWKMRLADIDLISGYNFIWQEAKHLGAYLQLVLPTGNKPDGTAIFQTVVGNRQHFELGGGISAHAVLWDNRCDQSISVHFEGNLTHMFSNHQRRLLDFKKNGPWSRYLLLREFYPYTSTPTGNLLSATTFNYQNVNVAVKIKNDSTLKFAYRNCGFGLDFGYNFYYHSPEKLHLLDYSRDCNPYIHNLGIAGITDTCSNFYSPITVNDDCATFGNDLVSQSQLINATFSNMPFAAYTPVTNQSADSWVEPIAGSSIGILPGFNSPNAGDVAQLKTSATCEHLYNANQVTPVSSMPVFITTSDLCAQSAAAPGVLTHKIFLFGNYQWSDKCDLYPHIGLGGSFEFADRSCNSKRPTLNQWGIMLKGGISF